MTKRKNKRKGLRSANGRKVTKARKVTAKRVEKPDHEVWARPSMSFYTIDEGTPREGAQVLVRLTDGTYRFGMVIKGRFHNYEYHAEEYVTFAHASRITHFMEIIPPVPFSPAKAEAETPEAESSAPSIMEAALAAGGADDAAEDVYR